MRSAKAHSLPLPKHTRGVLAPLAFVLDGETQRNLPATARDALRSLPRGAYTVARTWHRQRIVDWGCVCDFDCASVEFPVSQYPRPRAPHRPNLRRLRESLRILEESEEIGYGSLPRTDDDVAALITGPLRLALSAAVVVSPAAQNGAWLRSAAGCL